MWLDFYVYFSLWMPYKQNVFVYMYNVLFSTFTTINNNVCLRFFWLDTRNIKGSNPFENSLCFIRFYILFTFRSNIFYPNRLWSIKEGLQRLYNFANYISKVIEFTTLSAALCTPGTHAPLISPFNMNICLNENGIMTIHPSTQLWPIRFMFHMWDSTCGIFHIRV